MHNYDATQSWDWTNHGSNFFRDCVTLLTNQIGIHDMTAEAILNKSRDLVVQALLVDPVVTVSKGIPDLVDNMIAEQSPWLDYLKWYLVWAPEGAQNH